MIFWKLPRSMEPPEDMPRASLEEAQAAVVAWSCLSPRERELVRRKSWLLLLQEEGLPEDLEALVVPSSVAEEVLFRWVRLLQAAFSCRGIAARLADWMHDVQNPLAIVSGNLQLLEALLPEVTEDPLVLKALKDMDEALQRVEEAFASLRALRETLQI